MTQNLNNLDKFEKFDDRNCFFYMKPNSVLIDYYKDGTIVILIEKQDGKSEYFELKSDPF